MTKKAVGCDGNMATVFANNCFFRMAKLGVDGLLRNDKKGRGLRLGIGQFFANNCFFRMALLDVDGLLRNDKGLWVATGIG